MKSINTAKETAAISCDVEQNKINRKIKDQGKEDVKTERTVFTEIQLTGRGGSRTFKE